VIADSCILTDYALTLWKHLLRQDKVYENNFEKKLCS
jgi:hypothetical protein